MLVYIPYMDPMGIGYGYNMCTCEAMVYEPKLDLKTNETNETLMSSQQECIRPQFKPSELSVSKFRRTLLTQRFGSQSYWCLVGNGGMGWIYTSDYGSFPKIPCVWHQQVNWMTRIILMNQTYTNILEWSSADICPCINIYFRGLLLANAHVLQVNEHVRL